MRLIALMYHRARSGPHGNSPEMLDAHFEYLAEHYNCVLPGEPLDKDRLNVCLTFDDAYYDFYAIVFPLLKKHRLRAVLAVPPVVVSERSESDCYTRLEEAAEIESAGASPDGFCTWDELKEMAQSGNVSIAAHGYSHCALDASDADLDNEVAGARDVLSDRLGQKIESFMFPYGRFSARALQAVQASYRYSFRIGGADNSDWNAPVLYRVTADNLRSPTEHFTSKRRAAYRLRHYWNRLRKR